MNTHLRRTIWLFTTAVLTVSSIGTQALELRGFRGLAWGADVTQLGDSEPAPSQGGMSCYVRSNDNPMFGSIALTAVNYCFAQGQFVMVSLQTHAKSQAIQQEFQRTYGPPNAVSSQLTTWGHTTSRARAELSTTAQGSTLTLYSNQFDLAASQSTPVLPKAEAPTRL